MKKLFSTNNPYYDLYAPNAPENANVAGFGDWFSFLRRGNTEQYNDNGMSDIGNNNTNYLNGNSGIRYDQMGSLGQQQQQFDFDVNQGNPYTSQMMQTGQSVGEVLDNSAINKRKQIEGQQQKQDGNNNGGNSPNWGGVIAAAGTNTINAIRNGGSKAEIAAGIMGIPSFAKMWTYDDATEKKRMNEIKDLVSSSPENKTWITDSSSSGGAFNGIKLNTQQTPNLINTSKIKNFNDWEDFSAYHKGKFGKNLGTAMIEGTMSGSVGGPWGMLGGAVTGLFGSLFGRIGAKKRAQRAQNIANSRVNDYRLYYNAENFRRQAEYDLANKNLLNNGLKQQNISEMSNFKAYGGNLYPDGDNLDDDYVYEGGILPEVSITEEAMPWYEKWYNKSKRALGRGWDNVKKVMSTPTMTALPGQSPTFQGQFFPTMPSTVGDDLEYALSIVSAPWDMEGIGQAAWVLKHPKEAAKLMKQPVDKLVEWAKKKVNKEHKLITDDDWDNAYNAAIKANDMVEAQKLRDAHFLERAGNGAISKNGHPEIMYHSVDPMYDPKFNSFDTNIEGRKTFVYTTNNKNMSRSYTKGKEIDKNGNIIGNEHSEMSENQLKEAIESEESIIEYQLSLPKEKQNPAYIKNVQSSLERHKKQFYNKKNKVSENYDADNLSTTKSLYGKLNSPWIIEGNYNNWSHIPTKFPEYNEIAPVERSTREVEDLIQINNKIGNKKYDGAIMNNISDWGSTYLQPERDIFTLNTLEPTVKPNPDFYGTVYSFENPKNLKYRDAITYDDAGNIIPLSKRDNFNINDLRYGLAPLLGLTGYNLTNNTDNTGYAMGGNLYTDLSPNMMNLWNDKQNIDKQKVMNQQMNFGLGNSFNQKLNTFDYGGNLFEDGGVIFNGRLFRQRNDGNYVKYNDPEFVVTKEDMEKALREGLAYIDSGIINWKGRLFERGNDNNYHAVDDPEYTLERHNAEELIRNGEAKNVNSIDIIANKTNKNNIISTPEDLHKAFYGDIGNTNVDTNNIINTPEDLHRAFYGNNNDVDDKDATDKSNIINTTEDLHKEFYKDDNITAKKTPSKESTEKQKEYYNKKRQSYAEFNKDMGFLNKDDVKRFQEAYNREHEDKLKVDGLTGDKTIKAYQRWVNELNKDNKDKEALKIDGFYGKKSKSANNSDVANRMLNNEDFDINMLNNATVSTNEEPIEEPVQESNIYEQENPEEVYSNEPPELTQEERYNMFQGYMNTPNFLRNPYYDKLTGKPIKQEAILQQGNKFNNITDTNILQYSYGGNLNRFDYGGAMNGMDLPTDMQYYENGGTHEGNPNGGIQVGVDPQGNPNLVEEGEFRYGDKVLSDRLNVNPDILSLFNAPKSKGDKTYAEVGKRLADKAKEGLNDPITKRTLDANMGRLFNSQEYQKKEAELDAQKDQQLAEYKNTLESPTQGNPMYGSMKYSGMGNANQGLNAGADEGMGNPMDSSDLSNVNRSGNAMMGAYGGMFANGGNLYPYGGYSRTPEDDAQLSFVKPLFNIGNYQNDWTKRYTDEYVDAISKKDPRVIQQILKDEGLYDGKIDGIWGKKSKAAWDEFNRISKIRDIYGTTQNAQPQQTTTTQTTTTQTNTPTQTTTPTNTSNSNSKSIYVKEKSSGSDVNSALNQAMNYGDKTGDVVTNNTANSGIGRINPVEKNGEYGRLEAQPYGLANPNVPWLSEAGKYANLAKYTMPFMTDQKNLTNWKYNINPAPANRLQAKGESSYANRTAEHLGDYVAPNLMDIERLNNAAMAQTAAQQRGTNNISGGNRGFANSQNAAIGFNGQMATGQNYATTNEYNANQKMTAANFNRDTNKFNVDADNEMHKDNLNSWLQGRNMDLNANIAANQERLNERQYKDRVDRDAALNRQDNLNAMFNNQMNFIADEAKRRRELNEFNTLKNNRFYYDPRSGWNQKDDNGFNFEIADRLQSKGLYGFTGERDTAYKNLLKEKNGANFDKNDWKYIDKLIQMESDAKAHEQELVDAKKLEDRNNNLTEIQDIVSALNNTRDFHAWDSQRDYYNGLNYGDMSDEQVKRQLDFLRSIRNNYFNPQYWSNQSKTES